MKPILVNDTFEALSVPYRLLHVDEPTDSAFVIQLDEPHPFPQKWKLSELQPCAAMADVLGHIPDVALANRPANTSGDDADVSKRRWRRIEKAVARLKADPSWWERENLRALIRTEAANAATTEKTLLADLRNWWLGGQSVAALQGNYWKCGRVKPMAKGALVIHEKSPNGVVSVVFAPATQKARGRNPVDPGIHKLALPDALRSAIYETARTHYLKDKTKSVHGATVAVLADLFSLKDENGEPLRDAEGAAVLKEPGQRPTFHQIRYLLRKALPASTAFVARNSVAEYLNDHAPATGSVQDDCLGPGDVYEIDATVLDIWVVARANRAVIIGKPTLYLVIDRGSGLIVGFYLTLDPPSWAGGRQAILSIGQDWEALCKRLGVPYFARDWPAQGVMPNRFFADRGDMISYGSDLVCDGLLTSITNAPALLSRRKPFVESGFIVVSAPMRQDAPGYEPPKNFLKRRAKKYHKDACFTLDELAAMLLRIVIKSNRSQRLGYVASPEEILNNLSCSPIDIWNRAIAGRMGAVARMPMELLKRQMRPRGIATVRNDGIFFVSGADKHSTSNNFTYKRLSYKHPDPKVLGEWHVRASLHGHFQVEVLFNPSLVDEITVIDPGDSTKQYDLVLTSDSKGFAGYSFAEASVVEKQDATNARKGKRTNEGHAVALHQDIEALSGPASAKTKAASKGLSPGQRLTDGPTVREPEAKARAIANNKLNGESVQYANLDTPSAEPVTNPIPALGDPASAQPSSAGHAVADLPSDTDPSISNELFFTHDSD